MFEEFSCNLLELVQGFVCIERNCITETSEIDLVFENRLESWQHKIPLGYFIVQSKNQEKTTDINAVTHLCSELRIRALQIGILITSNKVSENGRIRIAQHFLRDNYLILVIDENDLDNVFDETKRIENILSAKEYELRFNQRIALNTPE